MNKDDATKPYSREHLIWILERSHGTDCAFFLKIFYKLVVVVVRYPCLGGLVIFVNGRDGWVDDWDWAEVEK